MGKDVFLKIKNLLNSNNIDFKHIVHGHVHTSADAAKIRGNSLEQAAKAIVLRVKGKKSEEYDLIQCVLSGNKKIFLKELKRILNLKNASLASPEDVVLKTGCTIGSVPPFGHFFSLKVYADESLFEQDEIVFSAGTHNDSIRMKSSDYKRIVKPKIINFTY